MVIVSCTINFNVRELLHIFYFRKQTFAPRGVGGGGLPYKSDGGARQKIHIKPPRETNVCGSSLKRPMWVRVRALLVNFVMSCAQY